VGLRVACGELSHVNLSQEWGRKLGPQHKLAFVENVFGDFAASCFFSPNVQRLKDSMRAKIRARISLKRLRLEERGSGRPRHFRRALSRGACRTRAV
jgi:hypothetical protein